MRKLRIAHVIESLGRGGAERLLVTNLRRMDRSRFENAVVSLFRRDDLLSEINEIGVRVACLEIKSFYDWRKGFWGLRDILKDLKPDIVHTVLQKSDFYGRIAAKSLGVRSIISTLHECPYSPEVFIDNPQLNRFKYFIFKLLDKSSARLCNDGFIVVSEFTKKALQQHFSIHENRIRLLYSSLDLEYIDTLDDSIGDEIKRDLGIEKDDIVLVNVGRLVPQKGQKYLILAMREICKRLRNVKLLIRGDGPLRSQLAALIKELGLERHVLLLDKYRAYRETLGLIKFGDVFVFPSLYEGLGIALLEANALGRPCVASDTGPIPEIIENGRNGILVPPINHVELAETIVDLISSPGEMAAMGKNGREIVHERFDIRKNIEFLEEVYLESIENKVR